MEDIKTQQRRKYFFPNFGRICIYGLVLYLFPFETKNQMYFLNLLSIGFAIVWFLVELFWFLDYQKYPWLMYFPFTFDMGILSILIYITGGVNSPLNFFYVMLVISDTIYSDTKLGFHAMIFAVISYLSVSTLTYFGILEYINILNYERTQHYGVFLILISLFIFPVIMLYFNIQEVMNQKKNLFHALEAEKVKLERSQKEVETLNEISKKVNDNSDISKIMEVITNFVYERYGIDICAVYMVNEKNSTVYNFYYKCPESIPEKIIEEIKSITFPLRDINHVHGYVYSIKDICYTQKLVVSKNDDENFIISNIGITSFLCMPLIVEQKVIGFLDFSISNKPMILSEIELESLRKLANQVSGVILKSNLYLENQKARVEAEIEKGIALVAQRESEEVKQKLESLLLNILPKEIVEELQTTRSSKPAFFSSATILFTDFQGFTKIAEELEPSVLIRELDYCFSKFDELTEKYNLEKLKTIGDSYMCVGGIPKSNLSHPVDCVLAGLGMLEFMKSWEKQKLENQEKSWSIRIGIHTGPLIAGIIGQKKFAYDVWGDSVNIASRMESSSLAGKINISRDTYLIVQDFFDIEYRGKIEIKNRGKVDMYFVNSLKTEYRICESNFYEPNSLFWENYRKKFLS